MTCQILPEFIRRLDMTVISSFEFDIRNKSMYHMYHMNGFIKIEVKVIFFILTFNLSDISFVTLKESETYIVLNCSLYR